VKTTVRIEGIENVTKFFEQKSREIIDEGQRVEEKHMNKILDSARSKINNISGETANSLKAKITAKSKTFVVAEIGTLGGTKEEAIRANSLEYGHALPGRGRDTVGKRAWKSGKNQEDVPAQPFIRPAIDEDKNAYRLDMKKGIQKVCDSFRTTNEEKIFNMFS
jgi:hypothetical protein